MGARRFSRAAEASRLRTHSYVDRPAGMVCRMPRRQMMRMAASDAVAGPVGAYYRTVRERTVSLTEPLSAEDCCVQSMPDASPIKWHLAHTTWFFETFVLERFETDFHPFH